MLADFITSMVSLISAILVGVVHVGLGIALMVKAPEFFQ